MKYTKAHSVILYTGSLFIFIVSILLMQYFPTFVLSAYRLHGLLLAIVLLFIVSPFGNQTLSVNNESPKTKTFSCYLRLLSLQCALYCVFLGIFLVFSHWVSFNTTTSSITLAATFHTLLIHNGLLPWGVYALYAGRLAYLSYIKNQDTDMTCVLSPLIQSNTQGPWRSIINTQARSAAFSVWVTTFGFFTLLIAAMMLPNPLPTGFYLNTLITTTLLGLWVFTSLFKKIYQRLWQFKLPLSVLTLIILTTFALLIVFLSILFKSLHAFSVSMPAFIQWFEKHNSRQIWMIFSSTWWLAWTPVISPYIARLFYGHSVRTLLLCHLLCPLGLAWLTLTSPHFINQTSQHPIFFSTLALIALIYLLSVLTQKASLPLMIQLYLPRLSIYKHRNAYFYFRKLYQVTILLIYLYLPAGINLAIYIIFTLTLFFLFQIPWASLAALYEWVACFRRTRAS